MTVSERTHHLIQQISAISDEGILTMLEDELAYHLHTEKDMTDDLTPFERSELIALANEPTDKNTVSLEEFRKATESRRREI